MISFVNVVFSPWSWFQYYFAIAFCWLSSLKLCFWHLLIYFHGPRTGWIQTFKVQQLIFCERWLWPSQLHIQICCFLKSIKKSTFYQIVASAAFHENRRSCLFHWRCNSWWRNWAASFLSNWREGARTLHLNLYIVSLRHVDVVHPWEDSKLWTEIGFTHYWIIIWFESIFVSYMAYSDAVENVVSWLKI